MTLRKQQPSEITPQEYKCGKDSRRFAAGVLLFLWLELNTTKPTSSAAGKGDDDDSQKKSGWLGFLGGKAKAKS